MIKLYEGEIKDILPVNLITPEVKALSYSIGKAMKALLKFSAAAHLYADLKSVPDDALDLIAMELNTQYYLQTLPREIKESLIRQTLQWYMHGGTPSVLEEFLATILDGGRIDEWYQYGGNPYFFRAYVYAGEHEIRPGYGIEVKRQIEKYKNVRSWIDWVAFVIGSTVEINVNYRNIVHFQNIFHPRKNIAYLKLDGKWKLDGSKVLSGYDDEMRVDFYPVRWQCSTSAIIDKTTNERIYVRTEMKTKPELNENVRYQSETDHHIGKSVVIKVSTHITENISLGDIGITTVRRLDGAWELDGSCRLNGGYHTI